MGWEGDTVFRQNRMMEWGDWRSNLRGAGDVRLTRGDKLPFDDGFFDAVMSWNDQLNGITVFRSIIVFALDYERPMIEAVNEAIAEALPLLLTGDENGFMTKVALKTAPFRAADDRKNDKESE